MDNSSSHFERTLAASIPALRALLVEIDHWARSLDLAPKLRKSILVFTEETFLNAVKHGTHGHRMRCTLNAIFEAVDSSHVRFTLKDNTPAFNPLEHPAGSDRTTNLAQINPGGLGIALMRKIAYPIHYKWDNEHNELSGEICVDSGPEA